MDLKTLQVEHKEWLDHNFPDETPHEAFLGMVEELGELAHAILKHIQKIRGMEDEAVFEEHAQDAIGDYVVYLAGFCTVMHWDLDEIVEKTWEHVKKRDWQANPETGGGHGI